MLKSKRRGRPRADRARDVFTGSRRIAFEVFIAELRYGRKRGDLTKAERDVAARFRMNFETVRRAASRHRNLRMLADSPLLTTNDFSPLVQIFGNIGASWKVVGKELERRMSAMPDDVKAKLLAENAKVLMEFLRANSIDGTCPQWLINAARSGRELSSPK